MVNIHYIRQKEPRGLGHAILCAKSFVGNQPFAVLLGDDIVDSKPPCLEQMIDVFNLYNTSILGVQHVPKNEVDKYGIVDYEPEDNRIYKVNDLVEKPKTENAPSDVAILGRYIITPTIFEMLEKTEPGAQGEIQLTDALKMLCRVEPMYAYEFTGKRYDVGHKLGFLEATVEFALKRDDLRDDFLEYLEKIIKKER
jgi:UTP--glucose-1-phosphate uridylyltransferase